MNRLLAQNSTLDTQLQYVADIKYQIDTVVCSLIVIASLVVFVLILRRRRTETFIMSIPFMLATYAIFSIVLYFHLLNWDNDRIRFFNTQLGLNVLISLSNFSLAIVYWIFAFQYLRTSLILPKLLID